MLIIHETISRKVNNFFFPFTVIGSWWLNPFNILSGRGWTQGLGVLKWQYSTIKSLRMHILQLVNQIPGFIITINSIISLNNIVSPSPVLPLGLGSALWDVIDRVLRLVLAWFWLMPLPWEAKETLELLIRAPVRMRMQQRKRASRMHNCACAVYIRAFWNYCE